jgi:uncharacterized protein (TIGR01319 family)
MHRGRRKAEVLVADIGSTITKLSAFVGLQTDKHRPPRLLGQAQALTTSAAGDIGLGLAQARQRLETEFDLDTSGTALMASASAAGGLRMTVHGLTRDMTLRAAREASLGAGAIVKLTSAGMLSTADLQQIRQISPNIILLAGGVDYGDRQVVLENARRLASLDGDAPVIFAGNRAVRSEVERIFEDAAMPLFVVDNVYPRIDELNVEPVRRIIQEVFARHIVTAPGMQALKTRVSGDILPTPGAVLQATELIYEACGDVVTIDVGGATSDVHSVTEGSARLARLMVAPEPHSKRTVEGDLGVYINASHIAAASGEVLAHITDVEPLPDSESARQVATALTQWAVDIALWRHAGELRVAYGAYGRNELVEGRDLTAVKYLVGTGGALTRLGAGEAILTRRRSDPRQRKLLPPAEARVLLDRRYIMAAAGVLAAQYPEACWALLRESLGFDPGEGGA